MSSLIPLGIHQTIKRLGRVLFIVLSRLVIVITMLMIAGVIYESIAEVVDNRSIPFVGQLVDVGGYRMHISCMGTGSPTVVIDSGLGDWSTSWINIQTEVANTTRVCIYDRAGYAWSEKGPQPRTSRLFVTELHSLLGKSGISGPYVLVGHSLGGLTARLFASEYPKLVAGVVMVDSMSPGLIAQDSGSVTTNGRSIFSIDSIMPAIAQLGIVRLAARPVGAISPTPTEREKIKLAFISRPVYYQTLQDEIRAIPESLAQASRVQTLGDMPLIVLTRALGNSKFDEDWRVKQSELLKLSIDSEQLMADKSGHNIELDQPEAVIEAILKMVAQVR